MGSAFASEALVIAASPSLAAPLDALGRAFEATHPGVKVQFHYGSGLELRQTIATMQNRDGTKYFLGSGPIHVIAPGGDELITRLAKMYYILPETRTPYATASLVLVVPESLVDAPSSFETLAQDIRIRIAVADPTLTVLGQKTDELLHALGSTETWKGRLDVATDSRGVLDHLLNGKADAAIIFGPEAVQEANRVRVVAVAPEKVDRPVIHSMAMERYCPNRTLCEEFLGFVCGSDAQAIVKQLGDGVPGNGGSGSRGH
ncbi:MAG: molybdate ABC transporter substrate-binding protein [Nitrospirota bacterium]|nr:molybdate ABC transporter substrate-binding protein [Nitrospirota bacterium]